MKIGFMRFVDRWAGVPICCMLSALLRIVKLFRSTPAKQPVRKVLVVQLSEMGSAISGYSALMKIRETFQDVSLYYCVFREMQDAVKLLDVIPEENIITIPSVTFGSMTAGLIQALRRIHREQIDAVLDFELFSRFSALFCFLSGCRIRVGFDSFHMEGLYRGTLHTHRVMYNHIAHISRNFLSLVYALEEDPGNAPLPKKTLQQEDILPLPKIISGRLGKEHMLGKLRNQCPDMHPDGKIVVINPNGSLLMPLRRWPIEHYIALASRLLADPARYVVLTGTSSEKDDADAICRAVDSPRCINIAGRTTIRELIDLYNIADVMVSNDSGPPNFASLTDLPVLVLFGPETPSCYRPLGERVEVLYANFCCSPCLSAYNHRQSPCADNRCLKVFTPEHVLHRILALVAPSRTDASTAQTAACTDAEYLLPHSQSQASTDA